MTVATVPAPRVAVSVAGVRLPTSLVARLTAVEVVRAVGRPAQLRLGVAGGAEDLTALLSADAVRVDLGDHDVPLFAGAVSGVEETWTAAGGRVAWVRAEGPLGRLRHEPRTQRWAEVDLADVAAEVAGRHDLAPAGAPFGPRWPVLLQAGETDLAFLVRLAARHGHHVVADDRRLRLVGVDGEGDRRVLVAGEDLLEVTVDRRTGPGVVDEDVEVQSFVTGDGASIRAGTGAPSTGWLLDADSAGATAEALRRRGEAARDVVTGTVPGDPTLVPGARVRIVLGSATTDAVVTRTRHRIDDRRGATTWFTSEQVEPALTPAPLVLTGGEVVDVDDPASSGRVRVTLLAHGRLETGWCSVLVAGGGPARGLVAVPAVGDRVAVLGAADDLAAGVVLGGLHAPDEVPGDPIVDGDTRRTLLTTPSGARLVIDDDAEVVRLEDPAGSHLELGPEQVVLHAVGDLLLTAPGRGVRIVADAIDMDRG